MSLPGAIEAATSRPGGFAIEREDFLPQKGWRVMGFRNRPSLDPYSIVHGWKRLAEQREGGTGIGQSIYTRDVDRMAWWLEAVPDEEIRLRLLARFACLQREGSESPAFDKWLRDYEEALGSHDTVRE